MSVFKRLALLAAVVSFLPLGFTQTGGDTVGTITSALRAREFDKALQLLRSALQQSPKSAQLWTLQGIAFSGEDHEKEALASFRNALKISPEYLPALEGAAQLEYKAGSIAAIPLLQHVLRLRPGDPTSHAMLAVLYGKHGDCASAVQHFELSGSLVENVYFPGRFNSALGTIVNVVRRQFKDCNRSFRYGITFTQMQLPDDRQTRSRYVVRNFA